MEWIKCSDRLPEKIGRYIVTDGFIVDIGWCGKRTEKDRRWFYFIKIEPTHWQPLPPPPTK